MDINDFRKRGKEMVDYICDYLEHIGKRRVIPDVQPGYLRKFIPKMPPRKGEDFSEIMRDVDRYIMPGARIVITIYFYLLLRVISRSSFKKNYS